MKQSSFYLFSGFLSLLIGVLFYLLVRGVSQILPLYIFEYGYIAPLHKYLNSRSVGLLYFVWASFPSFIATISIILISKPLFKNAENILLCIMVFLVMSVCEIFRFHRQFLNLDLISYNDLLDVLANFFGASFSYLFIAAEQRRRQSESN